MKKITQVLLLFFITAHYVNAQNVGINVGGAKPDNSALLDLNTGNVFTGNNGKGLLVPNVALTSSTDPYTVSSPATSLMVYVPSGSGLSPAGYYYNSGTPGLPLWKQMGSATTSACYVKDSVGLYAWLLNGNSGTTPGTNFLGTTDDHSLMFKVNNQMAGIIEDGTSGTYITSLGYEALMANTTGAFNSAMGDSALYANIVGSNNTSVGYQSLRSNTASGNTAMGVAALRANSTGIGNTAMGVNALLMNTTGEYNTAIGYNALNRSNSGSSFINSNTAVGAYAMGQVCANVTGPNTALGCFALCRVNTGIHNVAAGCMAMQGNQFGNYNIAIGDQALYYAANLNNNIAIGWHTLGLAAGISGSGYGNNVAVGDSAMAYGPMSGASYNVAVGTSAMYDCSNGINGSSPSYNTVMGYQALYFNGLDNDNAVMGYQAQYNGGSSSVALGYQAMYSNTANNNVAVGYRAGFTNTSANANVTGSNNIYIGFNAGPGSSTQFNNSVAIGANACVGASNTMVFGSNTITQHEFNGALMPYYSGSYNAGSTGQVMVSQGANVAPQWSPAMQYQHTIFTPLTGTTSNLNDNQYNIINPTGAIAELIIGLPASPSNNDVVIIKFTQVIASITYSGGTVADGLGSSTIGSTETLTYDSATSTWY